MLTGNIFQRGVELLNDAIPENLYVGRLVCQVYDSFQSATEALEEKRVLIESAFLIRTDQMAGKEEFKAAWEQSDRINDSVLVLGKRELAEALPGLVFVATELRTYDFFYHIKAGDILDYEIPTGKFSVDLTPDVHDSRRRGAKESFVKATPFRDISIIQEEYTRFYMIKGNCMDHLMIDTGFGKIDLKSLQRNLAPGTWQVALTHGHKDHAGGCTGIAKIHGSKINLERAGVRYFGEIRDLYDGQSFRIGHRKITVIDLSGHSYRDYAFYVEPEKILICGDAIASGPNYTMCNGGDLERWIASLERLQQRIRPGGSMEIKELWCSHRKGKLENPTEAIRQMKEGLMALKEGRGERYGASVYGFGAVNWMKYGDFSYFY